MKRKTDECLAKVLWDYHNLKMELKKADVIMVMGSHDIQVADRGAELWLEGWAPLMIMSGGLGRLTARMFDKSEAELFAERAVTLGVPKDKILIENQSTNTGENVTFARKLLEEKKLKTEKVIVVQMPYMERRALATFKNYWPEPEVICASPRIAFEDYCNKEISRKEMIGEIVGDTQRIKSYSEKGFQIRQEIPEEVWAAYEELVQRGYTSHLLDV